MTEPEQPTPDRPARFSEPPTPPEPGAGAAFWAARGVRIEPEPDDEEGVQQDAVYPDQFPDEYAEGYDEVPARDTGAPAVPAQASASTAERIAGVEDAAAFVARHAGGGAAHGTAESAAAYEATSSAQTPYASDAPYASAAPYASSAPEAAGMTEAVQAAEVTAGEPAGLAAPAQPQSPGADSASYAIPPQHPAAPYAEPTPYAEYASAEDEEYADPYTDPDGDRYADPAAFIPAQQVGLDEVEPQTGPIVDGLAVLGESLAEARRARQPGPAPEPVWQLAEDGSTVLPPLRACLEAVLMVVDEPVTAVVLAQVVERPKSEVIEALRSLAEEYTREGRGFELRELGVGDTGATGWRIYSRAECAPIVEKFVRDGQQARLTTAALETLAVVAYRQPVSRSKVSAIRGVNCDGVMRTLLARGLVEESGTEHETGALLYRTTGYFLERMGLKSLLELPDLAPLLPSAAELEDEQL